MNTTPPSLSPPDRADLRAARGAALKAARNHAGLSARVLAERVNLRTRGGSDISAHAIYAYEKGKVLLSHEVGVRIAEVLNLHPGELLAGDPDFRGPAPSLDRPAAAPGTDTPTARWLALAKQPLAVAEVLARVLDARPLGDTRTEGFLSVFHLLTTDLGAVTGHPLAEIVRQGQRDAAVDHAADVVGCAAKLQETADEQLKNLMQSAAAPVAADDAGKAAAEALREAATALAQAINLANRAYGI